MAHEYRLVSLQSRVDRKEWEAAINEAAADGFEWVDTVSIKDGQTHAVMRRELHTPGFVASAD